MQDTVQKTVCYTGHRTIEEAEYEMLRQALLTETERQIQSGAVCFRTGGARGFDTMAALAVLSLRTIYPSIRLELFLPCPTQTRGWAQNDVALYEQILHQADAHRYISPFYYNGLLQQRNRAMLDGAQVCIAYLKSSSGGGTAYTSALAIKSGLEYVNLYDLL